MKLKAGALYFALIFALLVAVISGLLILFAFYNKIETTTYLQKQNQINQVNAGFEFLKSKNTPYQSVYVDLYGTKEDTIYAAKKHWGLFDVFAVRAGKKKQIEKAALIGSKNNTYNTTALYMPNSNKALSLSGKTLLKGNVFLSKAGIKRANIEGIHYVGSELVYGKRLLSERSLPKLNKEKLAYFKNILNGLFQKDFVYSAHEDLAIFYNVKNNFSEKTKVFKFNHSINLSDIHLKNNIIIYSKHKITVDKSAILENILLVAPTVIVKKETKGNLHIVARDSVVLQENAILEYPSSVVLVTAKTGYIQFAPNSKMLGDLVLNGQNTIKKKSFLDIKKNATIEGSVYCNGIVTLRGKLYGSLFCNMFYLKTSSAIYENYLLDAEINVAKKNKAYVSGFIFNEQKGKEIVDWLR